MPLFLGNTFLEAVGYAIVNSLWQFAILWLLHSGVLSLFNYSSDKRYKIGLIFQFTGFIWFITTFLFYFSNNSKLISAGGIIAPVYFKGNFNLVLEKYQLFPIISICYFILLAFFAGKWSLAYYQTVTLRKNGLLKIDVQWRLFVQQLVLRLGIKQKVTIHLSNLINSPLTIGFLKPVILIPLASINYLNAQQIEAVILHELAHIRRFDYLLNFLLIVADTLLFFNPFAVLISKNIKKERENSCDDFVLQFQYTPATYAEALFKIAANQTTNHSVFALQAAQNSGYLLMRIKRIIGNTGKRSFNFQQQLIAGLFLILSVYSFFIIPQKISANKMLVASAAIKTNHIEVRNEYPASRFFSNSIQSREKVLNTLVAKAEKERDNEAVSKLVKKKEKEANNLFSYVDEDFTEVPKLQFITTNKKDQPQKIGSLEQQLLQDVKVVLKQAGESKKHIDAITVKTMMLARIRQLLNENSDPKTESAINDQKRLQLLEKNIATNVITNVMASSAGSVQEADQIVTIQYTIPEDGSGNSYVFEYIIHPNNEAKGRISEKDFISKDTLVLPKGPPKILLPIIRI